MAHLIVRTAVSAALLAALPITSHADGAIQLEQLDSINTGGAEISAYDPGSRRLFTTSAETNSVAIVDASNPAALVQIDTISVSKYGSPTSVAVKNGVIAVAIGSSVKTDPGTVAFYRPNGQELGTVKVGALPDMVTFTPDGRYLLVANEGEPEDYGNDHVDPEGSISIVRMPHGWFWSQPSVRTVGFTAYNGKEEALRAKGVRIYGPGASAAQDFEPEYIAVTDDSRFAFVTLQENNAVVKLDIERALILDLMPLGYKDWSKGAYTAATYEWRAEQMPPIGSTVAGQLLRLGGFSGLAFEGVTHDGKLEFIANTDRGPNGEPTGVLRPFLLPEFSPRLVRFTLDTSNGKLQLTQQIILRAPDGHALTGLPNTAVPGGNGNTPHNDEVPVDLKGNILPLDPLGGDFEGVVVDEDGSFWMCDEYRPAIYHFNSHGILLQRYIPKGAHDKAGLAIPAAGAAGALGIEALPAELGQRRQNRGMEGIALRDGKIYGFMQSPARIPDTLSNGTLNAMKNVRIVELDPVTLATRQFLYVMDNPASMGSGDTRADKIGDAVATPEGFLVVERDDDSTPVASANTVITKKVYAFSLAGADVITGLNSTCNGKSVDQSTALELDGCNFKYVKKTLEVDLAAAGYDQVQKVEGLALLDDGRLAVINDNDFQVAGITIDQTTGTFTLNAGYQPESTILGLIERPGLDASDKDKRINIRPWPVFGMYEPDAIDTYRVGGRTYFVTANEGDSRDYDSYSEEKSVSALTLDPTVFPNATDLQKDAALGRLTVTSSMGDTDGDGDHDALFTLGGRSFSIWSAAGTQVFDSGSQLERITALAVPANFNASNDKTSFDNRSDNKGPEPEGIVIGEIGGRPYAFIGLERIGGVAVYDVSDPYAPVFVDYLNNRDFGSPEAGDLGPEGLLFIPAGESPNHQPLLVVSSEISGTVTTYSLGDGQGWKHRRHGRGWNPFRR